MERWRRRRDRRREGALDRQAPARVLEPGRGDLVRGEFALLIILPKDILPIWRKDDPLLVFPPRASPTLVAVVPCMAESRTLLYSWRNVLSSRVFDPCMTPTASQCPSGEITTASGRCPTGKIHDLEG